ncbi:MAG: phosphoglyceromutase [Chitinophagaceae bacterium]|nr:phosphoglyceromutase [Chitinophagaceae bacterium]
MLTAVKFVFCWIIFLIFSLPALAQNHKAENLLVVVLDGMRWQEVFTGADSVLVNNPTFTKDKEDITRKFWDNDMHNRRKKLFPFLWETIAQQGQLYGNRLLGNQVNVKNPFQLTYPGFSEMLTGYVDPAITSNRQLISQSDNVLEFVNSQKDFQGKVAVFATSDLFPYLLNRQNSKLYINADTDTFTFAGSRFRLLNQMQRLSNRPTTERPDLLTYFAAIEYLKEYRPRVLYLALGETDAFAHEGNYDQYLETSFAEDRMIKELWDLIQTLPQYKNKTTILLTCDHGRGDSIKSQWRQHGPEIKDSGQTWLAVMGPGIPSSGEVDGKEQLYQAQLAATIGAVLGYDFKPKTHRAMPSINVIAEK